MGLAKHAVKLPEDPFGRNLRDGCRIVLDCRPGFIINDKGKSCGKPDRAQKSQVILPEPLPGIADGAYHPGFEIAPPPHVIVDRTGKRVVKHAVDGEIAAERIMLCIGEHYPPGMAAVACADIGPERRDLKRNAALHNDDHAELRANADRMRKKPGYGLRRGIRRDIDITAAFAEKDLVADATAGK